MSTTEATRQNYQEAIDRARLVSFDVFDTLIHRVVFHPTHLFDLLAKRLASTDLAIRHPGLVREMPRLRVEAERDARARHHRQFSSHEVTLADIYDLLKETFSLDEKTAGEIMAEELRLEQSVVYPNPLMKGIYEYAIATGKPVVLCSDMYLPEAEISALLKQAGYAPPFQLRVSGDLKKSKHEGSLFDLVCREFCVAAGQVAHFGDNPHADFHMPRGKGIDARHFDAIEKHVDSRLRLPATTACADRAVCGLIQGSLRKRLLHGQSSEDFWFDIGMQVYGPLLLGKFIWLMAGLRREPVDKVLFFARDGRFEHRLYEKYAHQMGIDIPAEYVYFSRATLLVPSFTDMNIHRLWHLFSGRKTRSVASHLTRLDINPAEVGREIRDCGFASADDAAHYSDKRMFDLLSRLYPRILATARQRREAILPYIEQVAERHHRLAIVDIGWTGNMQGSFSRLLQLLRTDFSITGYYFGTFLGVTANHLPRNRYRSYLVHEGEPSEFYHPLINGGVELMEFALMAPHGTTLSYKANGDCIEPLLEENPDDQAMQVFSGRIQAGAMHFVEAALPIVVDTGLEHWVSTNWSVPFFRLVNEPSPTEAEVLGELSHSDTPTHTVDRLRLAEKLGGIGKKSPSKHEYAHALQQAFWKKGFEVRNR